jgi:hypothetical protein
VKSGYGAEQADGAGMRITRGADKVEKAAEIIPTGRSKLFTGI